MKERLHKNIFNQISNTGEYKSLTGIQEEKKRIPWGTIIFFFFSLGLFLGYFFALYEKARG